MSLDVLNSFSSAMSGPVISQLSALLDESEEHTRAGAQCAASSVLVGLLQQVATPSGSADLFRTLQDTRVDPSIVAKLPGILDNRGALDALRSFGESLLAGVFGTRSGGVINALSQVSGVPPRAALSLLSITLPLVLGMLRKRATSLGLDASGVTSLLIAQRGALERSGLDSRITRALGAADVSTLLGDVLGESTNVFSAPLEKPTLTHHRNRNWVAWMIIGGNVVFALLLLLYHGGDRTDRDDLASIARQKALRLASAADPTRVYFAAGDIIIDRDNQKIIASIAESVKATDGTVAITGYPDATGDRDASIATTRHRVAAVREALVAEGVRKTQIVIDPPGEVAAKDPDAKVGRVDIEVR